MYHDDPDQAYPSLTSPLATLPEVVAAFGPHAIPEGQQRIDWLLEPEHGQVFLKLRGAREFCPRSRARRRRI